MSDICNLTIKPKQDPESWIKLIFLLKKTPTKSICIVLSGLSNEILTQFELRNTSIPQRVHPLERVEAKFDHNFLTESSKNTFIGEEVLRKSPKNSDILNGWPQRYRRGLEVS